MTQVLPLDGFTAPWTWYRLRHQRFMGVGAEMAEERHPGSLRSADSAAGDPAVERFLAGDPETIAEALRLTRAAVNFRGFYVPHDERTELVQEVMMQLLRHLADVERDRPRNFDAFVRTLAYRRCVDWMRRTPRQEPIPDTLVADDLSPESAMIDREKEAIGQRVLSQLNDSCRDLIRRYTYEGSTFRQIAEQDGRVEKTVRNQMYKCLDRARTLLDKMSRRRPPGNRVGGAGS